MKQYLDFGSLCALGNELCRRFDLKKPKMSRIMEMYFSPVPEPIIVSGREARVWIDKYYAAFRPRDGCVRYVYLSRRHIEEETEGVRELQAERGLNWHLPAEIESAFQEALRLMRQRGTAYIVQEI